MASRKTVFFIAAAMAVVLLTGCSSAFERMRGYNEKEYNVIVEKKSSDLDDGAFYVEKQDGTYHRLYIGETSYNLSSSAYQASTRRVAWFGRDYDRIPTMHKGEKVAYRSTVEFADQFVVERFDDLGSTVGICGLRETATGRYKFSTDPNDMQIDIDASAGKLYQLGEHVVTLDRIGDIDLRKGNISRAGTIVGLERGRTYATELYIGTDVIHYSLTADVRAFVSYQLDYITNYEYTQGNTIVFSFPDWYQSGYYCINNYGIVRYIASDREFTENMDMSIPNDPLVAAQEVSIEDEDTDDIETVTFRTDKEEEITVRVTFEVKRPDENGHGGIPDPTARLYGDSAAYALNPREEGELLTTVKLPAGDYRVEISGLRGRRFNCKLTKKKGESDE